MHISHYKSRHHTYTETSYVWGDDDVQPRSTPGTRNIVGANVTCLRIQKGLKQKELAARLQSMGMDICESGLSRMECQQRLVQDYELLIMAEALDTSVEKLLEQDDEDKDPSV